MVVKSLFALKPSGGDFSSYYYNNYVRRFAREGLQRGYKSLVTFWTASQYVGKPTPKVLDYIIWLAYARYAACGGYK